MGTYLSTPVLEKHTEKGVDLSDSETPTRWAVVDMQGWRKSMEDAHVARTDVPLPGFCSKNNGGDNDVKSNFTATSASSHAKVFAVFDGHGGAEVARFCQIHLVPVLTSQSHWDPPATDENINAASNIGKALIDSFHALDRLIDDPNCREEIDKWRNERPPPYVAEEVIEGGTPKEEEADTDPKDAKEVQERRHTVMDPSEISDAAANVGHMMFDDLDDGSGENANGAAASDLSNMLDADDHDEDEVFEDSLSEPIEDDDDLENKASEGTVNDESDDDKEEYSSPNEIDDGEVEEAPKKEQGTMVLSANDAVALFQKLLHINGPADKADEEEDDTTEENGESPSNAGENDAEEEEASEEIVIPTKQQLLNPPSGIVAPSASIPTRIQNGRKICNLPDHPVHAGCTSVVAVIVGSTLVVANAGDSRAVICRSGGLTEPLSFDHKPMQNREMNRITNSGGFVNQFGRVNGNLNLSRSIGDLKYKQVPGIPPPEQMITAEPDILSTTLRPGDEFIVLGCDGIWDCLTNEECVKYVHDRINTKSPHEIGMEMLDEIVSADPRASQGIGGDNMTIMIIDLLPHSRSYHSNDC